MIRIPNVPGLQGTPIDAPDARETNVRLAPALAVNAALGGAVADAIGGVGEAFQDVADRAQKLENARAESEARMQIDSGFSQLQIDLEKDPDPVSRIQKTRQYFERTKSIAENAKLAPQVRDSLRQFHTEFAHKGTVQVAASSAALSMKRAGLQLNYELDAAVQAGDESLAMSIVDRSVAAGVQLPEQGQAAKVKIQQTLQERAEQKAVIEDPAEWLDLHPADQVPPGTDPARYQQMQDFAKGQMRKKTYEASANIMDGIVSGQITTEQQIEELTQDLRPTAVEELKNGLRLRQADDYKERVASPDYQAQVYGQLSAAIADFNPEAEDADARIAQIDRMMRDLKPGFQKDSLTKKFRTLESPEPAKNYGEFTLQQVDELHKVGRFGQTVKPENMTTQDIVDAGFLKDKDKLQRLGFSEDQAASIEAAARESGPLGQRKMIELWSKRPGGSVNASEIELAAANALRLGQPTIPFAAAGAVDAANETNFATARNYGIARMQMEDYLRLNPEAKPAEIDAAFKRITGESIKQEAKRQLIPARPTRAGMGETSMAIPKGGLKLSNYGYDSDTTPDSNSAKGIGHRNNKLVAGQSAAISKSLAVRLGLEHGDKIKIETTQGEFLVSYDDTVPASDSRTGDLPETIDIYRPKDGSNGWGGRVTKISKI